jgi:amidohydrolase
MFPLPSLQEKVAAPSLELPWHEDIVALRRDFHAHPELGFEEVRTSGIVAARLRELGLEVREGVGKTGVVGILRGAAPGPTVLVRADMDALPVPEANEWQWKSAIDGKMHACGHDAHMATGLTVARLLAQEKATLRGTVVFMFQPAEEGLGGAELMINDGLLDDPQPDFALALHVWSEIEVGKIGVKSGPVMACADGFQARIIGKGGHGAMPHQTVDPIVVASQVVLALQTTISRNLRPLDAGVVTVGKVSAGNAFNVIPNEAYLEGTVRAFDEPVRALLERRCREIIEELPPVFGATSEWTYLPGYPATVNDETIVQRVTPAFGRVVGPENVIEFEPTMGAEDMSYVLQRVPGCYFFVGGRNQEIDAVYPHHHPKFNIDERALFIGAQAMTEAVKELLQ